MEQTSQDSLRNNPAGRLHVILRALKGIPDSVNALEGWARVLNLPKENIAEILRRIAMTAALVPQIERLVRATCNTDHEEYLAWLPNVRRAFENTSLREQMPSLLNMIQPTDLTVLKLCANELSRVSPEMIADVASLEKLRAECEQLIERITGSPIVEPTRSYLLRQVFLIVYAIDDYQFKGVDSLTSGLAESLGKAILNKATHTEAMSSAEGKSWCDIMGRFVLVMESLEYGRKLLEGGISLVKGFLASE